jgi:hypothetical protein
MLSGPSGEHSCVDGCDNGDMVAKNENQVCSGVLTETVVVISS